jgi:O-antigen ligase
MELWFYHPIFGVGPNRFAEAVRTELGIPGMRHVVHNSFLQVLVEQGILGFIPFICIFILAYKAIFKLRKSDNPFYAELAGYLSISLSVYLLCCLAMSMQRYYLTWIYLSWPIVLEKISQNKLEQQKDTVLVL